MNNVSFLTVLSVLLIAFTGNAPASCMQEANLFIEKADKVKTLNKKCSESKLDSKVCEQFRKELHKAVIMQKLVRDCITGSSDGFSEAHIPFLNKSFELGDVYEIYNNRLRLEIMKNM